MLLLIIILLLAGVVFLSYCFIPSLLAKSENLRDKRTKETIDKLEGAFIFISSRKLNIVYVVLPFIFGFLGFFLFKFPGLIIGVVVSGIMPLVITKMIVAKRKKKFDSQIVDNLMIISSCLKGGLSLLQSLETVAEESPIPSSEEFSLIVNEVKVGVSLEDAMISLNKRMRSDDLDLVISSMLVSRETGGDLTKVFSRLISTIRDRREIKDMANTLTLQGRAQGIIMSAIPPLFVVIIMKSNPHHFDVLLRDETGKILLFAAVIMQILALFFIKKFSSVKV